MLNKFLIILWYIFRPQFYEHFLSLVIHKFFTNHDTTANKKKAYDWASANAVDYFEALDKLGLSGEVIGLDNDTIIEARKLETKSTIKMGGASHIHLLYDCVRLSKAKKVIETGVAYGWSSLAILKALSLTKNGKLFSVDMPYPRKKNENEVGIVIPEYLKKNWTLIRAPDRPGIINAINKVGGQIDLCHYDSDKSWWGRHYAYNILWKSLKSNGIFISDDIQDNLYFCEFTRKNLLKFVVVKYEGKFIGLIRKK